MTDPGQAVPTPPQGQPWQPNERQMPYVPAPASWNLSSIRTGDGTQLIALTIDTPTSRQVSFWSVDDIEKLGRRLLEFTGKAPDGLVIASMDELRQLGGPER